MILNILTFNFVQNTRYLNNGVIYNYSTFNLLLFYNVYSNIFQFFKNFFLKIPKKFKTLKQINYVKYSNYFITVLFKKGRFNKILISYKIIFFYIYKYLFLSTFNFFIFKNINIINFFLTHLFIIYKPIFFFNFVKKKTKKKKTYILIWKYIKNYKRKKYILKLFNINFKFNIDLTFKKTLLITLLKLINKKNFFKNYVFFIHNFLFINKKMKLLYFFKKIK